MNRPLKRIVFVCKSCGTSEPLMLRRITITLWRCSNCGAENMSDNEQSKNKPDSAGKKKKNKDD